MAVTSKNVSIKHGIVKKDKISTAVQLIVIRLFGFCECDVKGTIELPSMIINKYDGCFTSDNRQTAKVSQIVKKDMITMITTPVQLYI